MKKTLIILLSMIILNCGGSTTSNEVTAITIGSLGNEMKYDTTEFTVSAGATVKLTMKNNASMANMIHNVVIVLDETAVPNIVKYAIAKHYKFFTFTSIEPIFCHYAANYDGDQPGHKNNDFLYEAFPHLKRRIKMTGWEKSDNITVELTQDIVKEANFRYQSFITWEEYTLAFIKKVFEQKRFKAFHPAMLEEIVYWVKGKYYA